MNALPDDVIVLVCQYLTIPDIFALRLSSRRLASLIINGGNTIAKRVADNTSPSHVLLWRRPAGSAADFAWLKSLLPKYIAAVLVDRFRLRSPHLAFDELGFPAEAEEGDEVRAKVEEGVQVWNQLCLISRSAYHVPPHQTDQDSSAPRSPMKERLKRAFAKKSSPHTHSKQHSAGLLDDALAVIRRTEQNIAAKRIAYVRSLTATSISNFRLMHALLLASIYTSHDPRSIGIIECFGSSYKKPYRDNDHFDWAGSDTHRLAQGTSWVNWLFMHCGPALFFHQWWAGVEHHVRDEALSAWKERTEEQIRIEQGSWLQVQHALDERDETGYKRFVYSCSDAMLDLFRPYAFKRAEQWRQGIEGPREILLDVPYFTDFRVPEQGETLPGLYLDGRDST